MNKRRRFLAGFCKLSPALCFSLSVVCGLALATSPKALAHPTSLPGQLVSQLEEAENPDLALGLAESLLLQGKYLEAAQLAERALQASPSSERALFVLAKASISMSRLEIAQEYVDSLLKLDPTAADYHALQGMVSMFSDQPERAVSSLRKALALGQEKGAPDSYMASYANTLVLAHHRFGQKELALQVCLDALTSYPTDPDLYLSASRLYRESGDFQRALEAAQKGLEARPDFTNLYASRALAHQGLGQKEESEAAYRELLSRDPALADILRATLDGTVRDNAEYKVRVE